MVAVQGSFQEKNARFSSAEPSGRTTAMKNFGKIGLDVIVTTP
jgi:hypothetical protein